MQINNVLEKMSQTPMDPDVGITIVTGGELPGVSLGLAVVKDRIRPHYQKVSDEIYYVLRGEGELTVGGETSHIREGDVVIIPKGLVHGFVNSGSTPCLILFSSGPKFVPETDRFFPD